MALTWCVPLGAWTDARTVPDGMGASVALGPAVERIYRNMAQNRQLRLRNSAHTHVQKGKKIVGGGSVKFNSW
jgi:hypothetical protein